MSQTNRIDGPQPVQPVRPDVQAAIARAAQATGVDFSYLLAQAKIESSLNPNARAGTSSAAGLYQFTSGTWLSTLDKHGAAHGLDWADGAIQSGRVSDPGLRSQIMALRFDPETSAMMAAELTNDNRDSLRGTLGREPDAAELYMAHFLGADGAGRFLKALAVDPSQSAAALLPAAASANRSIFYDASGAARSLGDVMGLMRGKVAAAMDGAGNFAASEWASAAWPVPGAATVDDGSTAAAPPPRPSMADTLASTFGLIGGANGAVPDHVRAAYGKLQAFGM